MYEDIVVQPSCFKTNIIYYKVNSVTPLILKRTQPLQKIVKPEYDV
jgi:hypothetical protein